jgi:hypothetical protein
MKFDIIIGNPPYNKNQNAIGKRGGGTDLWSKFVLISINNYLKDDGYLCFIHPSGWRKPQDTNTKHYGLFDLMTKQNQLLYLEIHNTKDGMKVFKVGTRYDFYLLKKTKGYYLTKVKDEKGIISYIDLSKWNFLPNYEFDKIYDLLSNDDNDKCEIIFNRTNYGSDKSWVIYNNSYESRKDWVSSNETLVFKYPLIHSTPQKGIRYMYSSINNKGHFGISKVIFGESGIYNAIIDYKGEYGMTQHAMAIPFTNETEGIKIKKFIESNEFKEILNACSWSNFRIDWRLFTYFKKDFYI